MKSNNNNDAILFGQLDLFSEFFDDNAADEPTIDTSASSIEKPADNEDTVVMDNTSDDDDFINEGFEYPPAEDSDTTPFDETKEEDEESADKEAEDEDTDDDDEPADSVTESELKSKSISPSNPKEDDKPFVTKEEIERLKSDPVALKAKAIERLKSWLTKNELAKLTEAIEDIKESRKPDSSWKVHKKIQEEYNQNICLVAGIIPVINENEALAADVLHPLKSLSMLISFIREEARKAAEEKATSFQEGKEKAAIKSAVIDSDTIYEWVEDYFYRDEDKLEAERKAKAEAAKSSSKPKKKPTKKDNNEMSLFDMFGEA